MVKTDAKSGKLRKCRKNQVQTTKKLGKKLQIPRKFEETGVEDPGKLEKIPIKVAKS